MSELPLVDQAPVAELNGDVSEEDRQVEGFHKMMHSLFSGAGDIVIAQSVSSFMGCHMSHCKEWKRVIPGFVNEVIQYANVAIAAHKEAEERTAQLPQLTNKENEHGGQET